MVLGCTSLSRDNVGKMKRAVPHSAYRLFDWAISEDLDLRLRTWGLGLCDALGTDVLSLFDRANPPAQLTPASRKGGWLRSCP
jgi:hypothetical protein